MIKQYFLPSKIDHIPFCIFAKRLPDNSMALIEIPLGTLDNIHWRRIRNLWPEIFNNDIPFNQQFYKFMEVSEGMFV